MSASLSPASLPESHPSPLRGVLSIEPKLSASSQVPVKFRDKKARRDFVACYRATAVHILSQAWSEDRGQDIAEYAVMLAVILVIVVGTLRLIGSSANNAFSAAASSIQ